MLVRLVRLIFSVSSTAVRLSLIVIVPLFLGFLPVVWYLPVVALTIGVVGSRTLTYESPSSCRLSKLNVELNFLSFDSIVSCGRF